VTTSDGRFTVLMPHAERVFRNVQMSWTSGEQSERSPRWPLTRYVWPGFSSNSAVPRTSGSPLMNTDRKMVAAGMTDA